MKRCHWFAACLAMCGLSATGFAQDDNPASLFKQLDKNGDGQLERSEVSEERLRFFERMIRVSDKNEDGQLTAEEFEAASKDQTAPSGPPADGRGGPGGRPGGGFPINGDQLMERLDSNKDGKLTKEELPAEARERMGRLFEILGKEELTKDDLMQGMRQMMEQGRGQFLKGMDKNQDGKLSRDEVPEPMRERLAALFDRAGADEISIEKLGEMLAQRGPRPDGDRPQEGQPRPEGERPQPEGERRPDGQPRTEGPPPGGPRDGDRPAMSREGFRGPVFFMLLDQDRNGSLNADELAGAAKLLDELDRNKNGQLDMLELVGAPPAGPGREGFGGPPREGERRPEGGPPREGERRPEGGPPREGDRRPEGSPPPVGDILTRFDTDKDGFLSREEAPERMRENFDRIDTNDDGKVSGEELEQAMRALREAGGQPGPRPEGDRPRRPE